MSIRDDETEPRYTGREPAQHPDAVIDPFDRKLWELRDINDAVRSAETTHTIVDGLSSTTWIVQTIRVRELGNYLFIQRADRRGTVRLALPPKVTETIGRQADACVSRVRKKVARNIAAERKALGIPTGFAAMTPAQKVSARKKAAIARRAKSAKRKARKASKG